MAPNVLVIGSGGFKGFYYLGAMAVLEREHVLENVHTIVGVSVGSLLGMLYTLYSTEEMMAIAEQRRFDALFQMRPSILEIIASESLFDTTAFEEELVQLIVAKIGFVPTLQQLYTITGITLVAVATNFNRSEPVYFSRHSYPDMPCIQAVLMSCCVPFIFKQMRDAHGTVYVDGVLSDPCPVHLFASDPYRPGPEEAPCEVIALFIHKAEMRPQECTLLNFNYIYQMLTFASDIYGKKKMTLPTPYPVHYLLIKAQISDILVQDISAATRMLNEGMKFAYDWFRKHGGGGGGGGGLLASTTLGGQPGRTEVAEGSSGSRASAPAHLEHQPDGTDEGQEAEDGAGE